MFVIHPQDKTTAMLSLLYEGQEARVINVLLLHQGDGTSLASCIFPRAYHDVRPWKR